MQYTKFGNSDLNVSRICMGCMGFGDCEAVCPVNAITIEKSLARVDSVACIGCGMCARTCPTGVITTLPATGQHS